MCHFLLEAWMEESLSFLRGHNPDVLTGHSTSANQSCLGDWLLGLVYLLRTDFASLPLCSWEDE